MTLTYDPDKYPKPFGVKDYEAKPLYQAARDRAIKERSKRRPAKREVVSTVTCPNCKLVFDPKYNQTTEAEKL